MFWQIKSKTNAVIQLLSSVLAPFTTDELLPLTRISHRFNALVLRLLRRRLLATAPLGDFRLILECYHPSCKATEPYLVCTYRGTDEPSGDPDDIYSGPDGLRKLRTLYSRFKPHKKDGELRLGARRTYGRTVLMTDVANSHILAEAIFRQTVVTDDENKGGDRNSLPIQTVMLDSFENFSQLCVGANILGRGTFTTCVTLADGTIRLLREWLLEQAFPTEYQSQTTGDEKANGDNIPADSQLLWVDAEKTAGLKFRVHEVTTESDKPVLVSQDEEVAVTYEVELEGTALQFIRSNS